MFSMRKHNRTQTKPWKRIEEQKLSQLQEDLDKRLSRYAQFQYYNHLLKEFMAEKEKKTDLGLVPSHYFFADAVKIALHFRMFYKKQLEYSKLFGVPESAAKRIFEWSRELVYLFMLAHLIFLGQKFCWWMDLSKRVFNKKKGFKTILAS